MIRVNRGPEPPELALIRAAELARVEAIVAVRKPESKEFGKLYAGPGDSLQFKIALWNAQRYKCVYCERRDVHTNRDVEHYRPKTTYWWLAWTWENLLFACDQCNRFAKVAQFPLRSEAHRLRPKQAPPGREHPLLLNPGDPDEDPAAHLVYRRVSGRENDWWVMPRAGSRRGLKTIEVLKLNKPELRVMYSQHWLDIKPDIERLGHLRDKTLRQMRVGDDSALLELREQWRRVITARTAPSASLAAMSHDVFDHLFPMTLRQRFGLTLVRP